METASILIIFLSSVLVGITGYSVYSSFGSKAKNLRDPFEEHED
jgi:PsbN protein